MQELQLDLFRDTDYSLLLGELESLRRSQGKMRRKLFKELSDLQDKYDELKNDYDKIIFRVKGL